ncbi:hypothetical protein J28TS4_28150 [Paenibacillus lautus]|nr:hypothetical protein J28TS4_28150 [Paenibacillus lautus]
MVFLASFLCRTTAEPETTGEAELGLHITSSLMDFSWINPRGITGGFPKNNQNKSKNLKKCKYAAR